MKKIIQMSTLMLALLGIVPGVYGAQSAAAAGTAEDLFIVGGGVAPAAAVEEPALSIVPRDSVDAALAQLLERIDFADGKLVEARLVVTRLPALTVAAPAADAVALQTAAAVPPTRLQVLAGVVGAAVGAVGHRLYVAGEFVADSSVVRGIVAGGRRAIAGGAEVARVAERITGNPINGLITVHQGADALVRDLEAGVPGYGRAVRKARAFLERELELNPTFSGCVFFVPETFAAVGDAGVASYRYVAPRGLRAFARDYPHGAAIIVVLVITAGLITANNMNVFSDEQLSRAFIFALGSVLVGAIVLDGTGTIKLPRVR